MQNDRPILGILFMLGFCMLAPLGDSMAKLLAAKLAIVYLLTFRFIAQVLLLAPIMAVRGWRLNLSRRVWRMTALRTLLHIVGIAAMFTSLIYLPLADAVSIAFVMPFILLLLGKVFLAEEVGWHRLGASAVGFGGTLLILQPNLAEVGLPALLPLVVAVVFAVFMLVTRSIAKEVDAFTLQAVGGAMAAPPLVLLALFTGPGLPVLTGADWLFLALLGAAGTTGHLMMTWSLRFAPASTLAPMQYLEIPVATLFGWALFSDLPRGAAAAGIAVTVAAGLYVIARERRLQRATPPATTPAPPAAE